MNINVPPIMASLGIILKLSLRITFITMRFKITYVICCQVAHRIRYTVGWSSFLLLITEHVTLFINLTKWVSDFNYLFYLIYRFFHEFIMEFY